jgi:hypothetical protein
LGDAVSRGLPLDWSRTQLSEKTIEIVRRAKKNAVSSNVKVEKVKENV